MAEMGTNPDFTTIPVIILTSTNAEQELLKFDNFDPSRYCSKPIDLHRFNGILDKLTTTFSI